MKDRLTAFFNTPEQRESQARITKIKKECAEIQKDREARLTADHDFDNCMDDDCWICDTRAYERNQDIGEGV